MHIFDGKKFLFLDDNPDTVSFFKRSLLLEKATVNVCIDFEESVNLLRKETYFDCVFIDIDIPTKIPTELLKYRKMLKDIPEYTGQLFGLFLTENFPAVNYAYFTVFPQKVCLLPSESQSAFILDKTMPYTEFPSIVATIVGQSI